MNKNTQIQQEIFKLIESKREGVHWDFKQIPHVNKASLLHDIICLSNCIFRGNRYLIFGVTDPKEGANIVGVAENQKNRKSQVDIIDFLRSKSFAGDCRPEIELYSFQFEGKMIDVLVVFDNSCKPYYLTKDFRDGNKCVRANYIYTRTNDSNTPIDKSADISVIEKMWMQRFGLDSPPLERMKQLLSQPKNWFKDIGNKPFSYHRDFPEFRIEFSNVHEFSESYSFFYTNEKSYLGEAVFKYHSTTLFELEYMYCDEMRIALAVPDTGVLKFDRSTNWFYYYDLQSLNGIFLQFLTDGFTRVHSRNSAFPYVIFKNGLEKKEFIDYLSHHEDELLSFEASYQAKAAKDEMDKQQIKFGGDPIFIDQVTQLHDKWIKRAETKQQ